MSVGHYRSPASNRTASDRDAEALTTGGSPTVISYLGGGSLYSPAALITAACLQMLTDWGVAEGHWPFFAMLCVSM